MLVRIEVDTVDATSRNDSVTVKEVAAIRNGNLAVRISQSDAL